MTLKRQKSDVSSAQNSPVNSYFSESKSHSLHCFQDPISSEHKISSNNSDFISLHSYLSPATGEHLGTL